MSFIKPEFAGFFCLVFAVYWSLPKQRLRLLWLLAASCFFYMNETRWLILLIFASTAVDYVVALHLENTVTAWRRRLLLVLSVTINLSILAFFKYAVFTVDTTRTVASWFGFSLPWVVRQIALPLGISFYTFEAISYIVDVYRGKLRAIRQPLDYALYILFFPHLVAGPIVRSKDFVPQLSRLQRFSWLRFQAGLQLVLLGLFKKAIISDHLAGVIDPVFKTPGAYGSEALWLAVLGYAVRIYCDFSGYSDMAIGLAHMLGLKLLANFNMPYFASNLSDFWQRWHISLSSFWLRDYLYVPLGGNRHGTWRTYRNLLLTMALGGFWHGASWTFVIWGIYHGLLLVVQRVCTLPRWLAGPWLRPVTMLATFLAVCVGWVFFRAQSLTDAYTILHGMLLACPGRRLGTTGSGLVCTSLLLTFAGHLIGTFIDIRKLERRLPAPVVGGVLAVLLVVYLVLLPEDSKGFIYFQF